MKRTGIDLDVYKLQRAVGFVQASLSSLESRVVLQTDPALSGASATDPIANEEIRIQRRNDTEIIVKMRGSDGIIRRAIITVI